MFKVTVTLTFDPLTPKLMWIIYGSWPFMIQRQVYLREISLSLMSGHYLANAGRTDGWTDGQMDGRTDGKTNDMRHNIIRPKIPSCV